MWYTKLSDWIRFFFNVNWLKGYTSMTDKKKVLVLHIEMRQVILVVPCIHFIKWIYARVFVTNRINEIVYLLWFYFRIFISTLSIGFMEIYFCHVWCGIFFCHWIKTMGARLTIVFWFFYFSSWAYLIRVGSAQRNTKNWINSKTLQNNIKAKSIESIRENLGMNLLTGIKSFKLFVWS